MRRSLSMVAASAALCACASSSSSRVATEAFHRGTSRVLTSQEIATIPAVTAYEAVQRLRPQFLHPTRGQDNGVHPVAVYVDGLYQGGVEELRNVQATAVRQIRFLTAREATMAYGTGHSDGVIDVRTGPPLR